MPSFSFKREVDVRIVDSGGTRHKIDTSQIDFGQTFQERSFEVKTLHNQGSFEGSVINRANPAEFSLNTPLLKENTNKVIFDRLLDSATFDIYISTQSDDVWKLETCVIQDGTFEINKSRPLRLAISGEASKLSKFSGTIPGSDPSPTTTTYIIPTITTLTLGSDDVSDSIIGLSVELQNSINWNPNKLKSLDNNKRKGSRLLKHNDIRHKTKMVEYLYGKTGYRLNELYLLEEKAKKNKEGMWSKCFN